MEIFIGILSIICLYILYKTYYYLQQVEQCDCFKDDDKKYGVNIEYMKFFQILHIIIFIMYVSWGFFIKRPMVGYRCGFNFISVQLLILLLCLYGYMFYNILHFYRNVKSDCKCVDQSIYKYFIYFQGISSLMSVMQIIYSFLLIIIIVFMQLRK
jgi:hypothetical protein